jgi:toxin ParE1/3/4
VHKFRLSQRADSDIAGIADYTIRQFGIKQARRYRDGLEKIFRRLAEYPNSGRSAGHLAPRLRRMNFESHVIFFCMMRPVCWLYEFCINAWLSNATR